MTVTVMCVPKWLNQHACCTAQSNCDTLQTAGRFDCDSPVDSIIEHAQKEVEKQQAPKDANAKEKGEKPAGPIQPADDADC